VRRPLSRLSGLIFIIFIAACSSPERAPSTEKPPAALASEETPPRRIEATDTKDPRLEQFAREEQLLRDEDRTLAASYVRSARARLDALRYEEARLDLERATKLDPENEEARRLLDRVHVADPQGPRDFKGTIEALAEERAAREEQERVDVKRFFAEGELLLEKQRYDAAIRYFERVLEMIRWSPSADPGTFEARTREALVVAKARAANAR